MGSELGELFVAGLLVLGVCMVVLWPLNYLIGLPQWAVAALTFLALLLAVPLFLLYFVLPLAALSLAVERLWTRPRALKEAEAAAAGHERKRAARRERWRAWRQA